MKTPSFTLLSEELDSKILMKLVGGADASPIRSFPHDLITPINRSISYDPTDPEEY